MVYVTVVFPTHVGVNRACCYRRLRRKTSSPRTWGLTANGAGHNGSAQNGTSSTSWCTVFAGLVMVSFDRRACRVQAVRRSRKSAKSIRRIRRQRPIRTLGSLHSLMYFSTVGRETCSRAATSRTLSDSRGSKVPSWSLMLFTPGAKPPSFGIGPFEILRNPVQPRQRQRACALKNAHFQKFPRGDNKQRRRPHWGPCPPRSYH